MYVCTYVCMYVCIHHLMFVYAHSTVRYGTVRYVQYRLFGVFSIYNMYNLCSIHRSCPGSSKSASWTKLQSGMKLHSGIKSKSHSESAVKVIHLLTDFSRTIGPKSARMSSWYYWCFCRRPRASSPTPTMPPPSNCFDEGCCAKVTLSEEAPHGL